MRRGCSEVCSCVRSKQKCDANRAYGKFREVVSKSSARPLMDPFGTRFF